MEELAIHYCSPHIFLKIHSRPQAPNAKQPFTGLVSQDFYGKNDENPSMYWDEVYYSKYSGIFPLKSLESFLISLIKCMFCCHLIESIPLRNFCILMPAISISLSHWIITRSILWKQDIDFFLNKNPVAYSSVWMIIWGDITMACCGEMYKKS